MRGVSSVDQRYDATAIRDLMRRYSVPAKIVTDMYMKGIGRRHFMEGDFMEYGPLFGEKLRRLQEKWRTRPDNFLNDRHPATQKVVQRLSDFYNRHGMESRAKAVPSLIDSYSDNPEELAKTLPSKFPSLKHEIDNFLQSWVRDMKRQSKKYTLLATELDRFFEAHGDDTPRYVPFLLSPSRDIITAFSDDPKALFDILTGEDNNRPSVVMDLSWLLNWSDEIETGFGESLKAKDNYREQEDSKLAKLEMRNIRREMREVEHRCIDEAENEAERRHQILQLEQENENFRKILRRESVKRSVSISTNVSASQLAPIPEEEEDSLEVRQYYRQQAHVIAILQEKLRKKKDNADSLRRQLFEKQKSAFSNDFAADILDYRTDVIREKIAPFTEQPTRQPPDLDDLSPPPLLYETPNKKSTRGGNASRVFSAPQPSFTALASPPYLSSQFSQPSLASPGGASGWFFPPGKL